MRLLLLFFAWCSIEQVNSAVVDRGPNIALGKPVIGNVKHGKQLTDGNHRSGLFPNSDQFPYYYIDLQDVYNVSAIDVYGFYTNEGINISFSMYTWDQFENECDMMQNYPWHPVRKGLNFMQTKEKISLEGPIEAQYIIIMTDKETFGEATVGLHMNELEVYGTKLRDGYREKTPENNCKENLYQITRRALLEGQSFFWIQQQYGQFIPNEELRDVPIGWHHNRINTMAVTRGNGRLLVWAGPEGPARLVKNDDYLPMRNNVRRWLRPDYHEIARFVTLDEGPRNGDIVLIKRSDKFNHKELAQRIRRGDISVIIGYLSEKVEPSTNDDTKDLLQELEIGYINHDGYYMGRDIPTADKMSTNSYIPGTYNMELSIGCWDHFRNNSIFDGVSFEVLAKPKSQLIMKQLIANYQPYFRAHPICDVHHYTDDPETKQAVLNYNDILNHQLEEIIVTLPGHAKAPGIVHPTEKPTTYSVTLNVDIAGKFFPLGGYAKAGEAVRYKVVKCSREDLTGFYIRTAPQTDYIQNVGTKKRWPRASCVRPLYMEGSIATPLGGLVMLEVPTNTSLTIRLENVYRHAWFDITDPTSIANWDKQRLQYRGVPYTTVVGEKMISTMLTTATSTMSAKDMEWAVMYYDNVVKMMHNYRGTSWKTSRIEVFVTDKQLTYGWGHSGYPFMGHDPWSCAFTNVDEVKQGDLTGVVHEVGHNLQYGPTRFKNGGEVTNNLFIPLAREHLLNISGFAYGKSPGLGPGDDDLAARWNGNEYQGVDVSYYNYMQHQFTEALVGNVMHEVMRTTEPVKSEEEKVNFWIKTMCSESKHDLIPLHRLWHFPIWNSTVEACAVFPCYMPDDQQTKLAPQAVQRELRAHGRDCCRKKPPPVPFKFDLHHGFYQVGAQFIFFKY